MSAFSKSPVPPSASNKGLGFESRESWIAAVRGLSLCPGIDDAVLRGSWDACVKFQETHGRDWGFDPYKRQWAASEIDMLDYHLKTIGIGGTDVVRLNDMLPEGKSAPEARVFVWKDMLANLGMTPRQIADMYLEIRGLEEDRFKWNRNRKIKQNKRARGNSCASSSASAGFGPAQAAWFLEHPSGSLEARATWTRVDDSRELERLRDIMAETDPSSSLSSSSSSPVSSPVNPLAYVVPVGRRLVDVTTMQWMDSDNPENNGPVHRIVDRRVGVTASGVRYVKHRHLEHALRYPSDDPLEFTLHANEDLSLFAEYKMRKRAALGPFAHKVVGLNQELNNYQVGVSKSGRGDPLKKDGYIGKHGDDERGEGEADARGNPIMADVRAAAAGPFSGEVPVDSGIVDCLTMGVTSVLTFCYYERWKPIGRLGLPIPAFADCTVKYANNKKSAPAGQAVILVGHGDGYIMSGWAIGKGWKKFSQVPLLRHAAGAQAATHLPDAVYAAVRERRAAEAHRGFDQRISITESDIAEWDSNTPGHRELTPYNLEFANRRKRCLLAESAAASAVDFASSPAKKKVRVTD